MPPHHTTPHQTTPHHTTPHHTILKTLTLCSMLQVLACYPDEAKFGATSSSAQSPQDSTPPDAGVCDPNEPTISEVNIEPGVNLGGAYANGIICESVINAGEPLENAIGSGQQILEIDLAGVSIQNGSTLQTSQYTAGMQTHIARLNGPCQATSSTKPAICAGSHTLDTRNWATQFTDSNILDCNTPAGETTGCSPGETSTCASGGYKAFVDTPTQGCSVLDPLQLQFSIAYNAQSTTTSASDCESGSGRFLLLPAAGSDNDKDGKFHGIFYPMQVSGTGVMTPKAWITSITPVNLPTGVGMKAIKTNGNWFFTWSDMVQNASDVAVAINGTTSLATGILHGGTVFALEEILMANVGLVQADINWTCSRNAPTVSRPLGYQLRLSDMGCPANQKMTLRYATSPKRVYLESYGSPDHASIEPTVTTSTGQAFVYERNELMLDATLISASSTQAVIRVDDIRWKGQPVCTPGTYTLAVE